MQIKTLEDQITEISKIKHVSTATLEKYSSLDREISQLSLENEKYENLETLTKDCKTKNEKLTAATMDQAAKLESILNDEITKLNGYIFNKIENTPVFHIKSPKSYEFYTPGDDETGTNYKGLVVMDIATLLTTALPILIHDSVLLKQISNESIETIFEIYSSSEKQIFISIDKETSYTSKTSSLIKKYEVLKLSSGRQRIIRIPFWK